MPGYIYLPVPTREMFDFAEEFQNAQTAQGKTPYTILHNYESGWRKGFLRAIGRGVLRNVAADDKLYVLSHGPEVGGGRFTGARRGATPPTHAGGEWEGGTMKKYSPSQLAEVIKEEGLITSFVHLSLFICGSGLLPRLGGNSFAQNLAAELGSLGYEHIRVVGYLGQVSADGGFGVLLASAPGGAGYYPMEDNQVAFGPHGGRVPIPALIDRGI